MVFAKTDIQPLINEGAAHEDLAVSVHALLYRAFIECYLRVLAAKLDSNVKITASGESLAKKSTKGIEKK